ncbi:hypothetical protein [Sedimenticola hydrogenitrophicus]|uniref:hypothetical protein n=1 Tax=Sedimenticola hydrogenitrophicus TaxID=2967975 RepID=UPI0023B1E0E5|nr:hypothetical protein [Sedimenticola hydrogenitrophicus]
MSFKVNFITRIERIRSVGLRLDKIENAIDLTRIQNTEREKEEKEDLINAPFTVLHSQGIRGVFILAEVNEILQLTERLAA